MKQNENYIQIQRMFLTYYTTWYWWTMNGVPAWHPVTFASLLRTLLPPVLRELFIAQRAFFCVSEKTQLPSYLNLQPLSQESNNKLLHHHIILKQCTLSSYSGFPPKSISHILSWCSITVGSYHSVAFFHWLKRMYTAQRKTSLDCIVEKSSAES